MTRLRRSGRIGRLAPASLSSSWAVLDQVLVSAGNFAIGIAVARQGGARELGLFSVAFAIIFVAVGLQRALATDPLTIVEGRARESLALGRFLGATAAGHVVLVATGLAASTVLTGETRALALAATLAGGALLLQDTVRSLLLLRRGPGWLTANDAVTCGIQLAAALVFSAGAAGGMLAVGTGCSAGVVLGAAMLRGRVRLRGKCQLALGRLWPLGRWFGVDSLSYTLASQLVLVAAAAMAGAAVLGSLKAALAVFAPLQLVLLGLTRVWLVELTRLDEERVIAVLAARLRRLLLVCGLWGAAAVVFGESLVRLAYGADFQPGVAAMALLGGWAVLQAWYGVCVLEAKVRGRGRRLAASRAVSGIVWLGGVIAAAPYGVAGLASALALGQLAGILVLRLEPQLRALRVRPESGVSL